MLHLGLKVVTFRVIRFVAFSVVVTFSGDTGITNERCLITFANVAEIRAEILRTKSIGHSYFKKTHAILRVNAVDESSKPTVSL